MLIEARKLATKYGKMDYSTKSAQQMILESAQNFSSSKFQRVTGITKYQC